jgi:hypothetical protein
MNTSLTVKLNADANYIPVMYRVVETTVASTLATTYFLLEVVRVGWDTQEHYEAWIATKNYDTASGVTHLVGRNPTGMVGILGTLSISAANLVSIYKIQTPSSDS